LTEAQQNLSLLEAQLKGKRFFGGDSIGLVDIAASALAHWLGAIEEVSGVVLLTDEEYPELCNWAKRYVDDDTFPREQFWLSLMSPDEEAWRSVVTEAKQNLSLLEAQLKGKRFFGGDSIGLVDIAASMLAHWLGVIEEVSGVVVLTDEEFPELCNWAKRYVHDETVKQCLPKRDELVAMFSSLKEMLEEGETRDGFLKEAKELLPLLEAQLKGKKFFNGDTPGYLDIAASMLGPTRIAVEEVTGVALINDDDYPALSQWARDYMSNEALKPCMPDRDQLLAYFTKNKEMYKAGVKAMLQQK
ncbi:hypothetical protein EJB05_52694, partial [Eragrostis curvula]